MKYVIQVDFLANFLQSGGAYNPNPIPPKQFKKGDIIEANYQNSYNNKRYLVSSDGYIIPISNALPITGAGDYFNQRILGIPDTQQNKNNLILGISILTAILIIGILIIKLR